MGFDPLGLPYGEHSVLVCFWPRVVTELRVLEEVTVLFLSTDVSRRVSCRDSRPLFL
jgi:hypothetical protein